MASIKKTLANDSVSASADQINKIFPIDELQPPSNLCIPYKPSPTLTAIPSTPPPRNASSYLPSGPLVQRRLTFFGQYVHTS
ncbi:hypothetical protein AYI68_g3727 [Smittium mucronatum]|uniref:Uncharacterized protein n=1 Tax=Smittium mucronatum TaxID=133383 RepID=A0A1R0GZ43_9FUNG|nr:hypothetical protein AYI68_g3727 [Smittium mucronatum]